MINHVSQSNALTIPYSLRGPGGAEMFNYAAELSRAGESVLVACDEDKIDELDEQFSLMLGGTEHSIYKPGQAPAGFVRERLLDYLTNDRAPIKLIVHAALYCIFRSWPYRNRSNLIIDDKICLLRTFSEVFPGQHDLLAQHVKIIPEEASSYSLVVIDDPSEFDRKVENIRNDTALKAYAEMLSIVGNDCHWTRVLNEQYCEALTGKRKSVTFYSVRLPSVVAGFSSASIFADDFVGSLMEGIWRQQGAQFTTRISSAA